MWGVDEALLSEYIEVESDGSIILARGKPLQDTYLQKLVQCMESLFFEQYGVLPSVVADVNQHVYRSAGCVGVSLDTVTMETKLATEQCRLFRCLICAGISCIPEVSYLCHSSIYCFSHFFLKLFVHFIYPLIHSFMYFMLLSRTGSVKVVSFILLLLENIN